MKIAALAGLVALTALASLSSCSAVLIKPYSQQGNCLTGIAPGADGTALPASACSGASNQNWALDDAPGLNFYTFFTGFASSCAPKVIEAQGTGNAAPVTQVEWNPTHKAAYWNQISLTFPLNLAQSGYYFYQNTASGRCLTADVAGNPVTTWDCGSTSVHQLWNIQSTPIKNQLFSGNCLDVKAGSRSNGASITTSACNGTSVPQQFTTANKKPSMLRNLGTGKCADGGINNIFGTYQWACVTTAGNQHWVSIKFPLETNPDGWVYLFNMYSGLCLALNPANSGQTISQACQEGNVNQQWLVQ